MGSAEESPDIKPLVGLRPAVAPIARGVHSFFALLSNAAVPMKLAEGRLTIPVLALAPASVGAAAPVRLKSLDVMRGLVVVGMIVVNAMASSNRDYGFESFPALMHSTWAGFTFADFVFPAFVFMVGVSIAVSSRHAQRFDGPFAARVSARSGRLLILGFLLANIPWAMGEGNWHVMGVLQRIGLCYFAAALLFAYTSWRARAWIAAGILLLYWPLAAIPTPDGRMVDLLQPGANLISWFDRTVMGPHVSASGPAGYDAQGLLSTLPAIAQGLLGTLAGEWFLGRGRSRDGLWKLAAAGGTAAVLGFAWSPFFPIVKNIWSSSFVLVSSGLAALLLAACAWLLDRRRADIWGMSFFEAFGVNAILAYVVHELAQFIPASESMHTLSAEGANSGLPELMAFFPIAVFLAILWIPLEYMRRKRWIVKI